MKKIDKGDKEIPLKQITSEDEKVLIDLFNLLLEWYIADKKKNKKKEWADNGQPQK